MSEHELLERIREIVRDWRACLDEESPIVIRGDDFMGDIEDLFLDLEKNSC